ncbi:ABC transporter ATP-binding protein [Myxococcus sp. MISCRS1]|jgi:phospholipid/cholesterol/gamma-HCH transport system ATP-binding protein|uniref:ABC transporter ATP-binding protein n=1 Tax=Myxococcus TaxID=32 RepID=UPI001CBA8C59|nr:MULTISPECIES: ABC transporter ATP-binding protein [unclassified Myxococcus]MBZ4414406.1 ABC transporter ATP-binding protein [Myxococcus sp. XM-1-1-1]MCY0999376.1 ABC transporter ATP-binding protein [Myxococcus sp. MISCRS1]BDT30621.1 ABC transporter ATP-binding protein [Myxococcus sp. MH1]
MPFASRHQEAPTFEFQQPTPGEQLIHFQHLQKSFGAKRVYDDLELDVRAGETLVVLGGSGTGKSVLLKCLIGLQRPDAGRILFQGRDVTGFSEGQFIPVRRHVAMVFQGAALFDSLSVGENVAYPLREHYPDMPLSEVRDRVAEKLELVNLPGTERLMPADLSGGMKKRVGLARAIATNPEVILWDEPTTGLDPVTTQSINAMINSMKTKLGSTSIVVTHDLVSAFAVGDRMAMLANRRIVQVGTPGEFRRSTVPEVRAFLDARRVELEPEAAS